MTEITLEAVVAKQSELAAMIEQLARQEPAPSTTLVQLEYTEIELHEGEHYAGAVLDEHGEVKHHLVLMAEKPTTKLEWRAAVDWAASVGGELPTRQEQALLFANCKPHMQADWHWSGEMYESDASYAWSCDFDYGGQYSTRKSYEGCARAVRRV
jgi:hypothetical protein